MGRLPYSSANLRQTTFDKLKDNFGEGTIKRGSTLK